MKPQIAGLVLATAILVAPLAHAQTTINDPVTDTLQLWSEVASAFSYVAENLAALFNGNYVAADYQNPSPQTESQSLVAAVANPFGRTTASTTTPADTATNATTDQTISYQNIKSDNSDTSVLSNPAPQFDASNFVTQNEVSAYLLQLSNSLTAKFTPTTTPAVPEYVAAGGNPVVPYGAAQNISNLSGVTISNSTIDSGSLPDLSGTYLSLAKGGTVSGNLTVIGSFTGGSLTLSNASTSALVATDATSTNFFATSASTTNATSTNLYAASAVIPALSATNAISSNFFATNASTTNATSTNLFVVLGNLTTGIINTLSGTTLTYDRATFTNASTTNFSNFGTAYFGGTATTTIDSQGNLTVAGATTLKNATSTDFFASVASSTNLYAQTASLGALSAGMLALNTALPVTSGGTGWNAINSGSILFGDGSSALATSSNFYWDNTDGRLGIGTSSPSYTLAVNGPAKASQYVVSDSPGGYVFQIEGQTGTGIYRDSTSNTLGLLVGTAGLTVSGSSGQASAPTFDAMLGSASYRAEANNGSYLIAANNGSGSYNQGIFYYNNALSFPNNSVGIGTSSPATTLSVAGNGYLTGGLGVGVENTTAGTLTVGNTNGTLAATPDSYGSLAITGETGGYYGLMFGNSTGQPNLLYDSSGNGGIFIENPAKWVEYYKNSTSDLNINTANDLGATLGVNGTFYASGNITSAGTLSLTGTTGTTTIAGGQGFTVGGSQFVVQQGSGNVGIGTTNPSYPLDVTGTIHVTQTSGNGLSFTGINPYIQSNDYLNLYATHDLVFAPGNTERMRLVGSTGDVGIDAPSPQDTLDIGGGLSLDSSGNQSGSVNRIASNGNTGWLTINSPGGLYLNNNTASGVSINDGGSTSINGLTSFTRPNTGLNASCGGCQVISVTDGGGRGLIDVRGGVDGTTFPSDAVLDVGGAGNLTYSIDANHNINAASGFTQNSDERLKTNIAPLDPSSSLAEIEKLNPVSFNWKDAYQSTSTQFGVLAQQLQTIFPNLVLTGGTTTITLADGTRQTIPDTLSVNYIGLITPMVAAIQDIANISSTFEQNLIAWLGNASNGIAKLFAGQIDTQELCINDGPNDPAPLCLTKTQLAALLSQANTAAASESVSQTGTQNSRAGSIKSVSSPTPKSVSSADSTDTPPQIQINGDNPAVTGPTADVNLGIHTFVNGAAMSPVQIDTTEAATDTIDYVVTDQNGLTSTSTRTVIIEAPSLPAPVIVANLASSTAASSTTENTPTVTQATTTSSVATTTAATTTDATSSAQ